VKIIFSFVICLAGLKASAQTLRVLVYDSFAGKGSLGDWIATEFQKRHPSVSIEWVVTQDVAGLEGRLKSDFQRKRLGRLDAVLGLSREATARLVSVGLPLVPDPVLFEQSPFAVIVDRSQEKRSFKTWKEFSELKKSLLVQDPSLSSTGFGFLRAVFEFGFLDLPTAKSLVARLFPSWSASYSAFQKKMAPAVWSYLSSEAYHRCEDKTERFEALVFAEGMPIHESYFVRLQSSKNEAASLLLQKWLVSVEVQEQIPKMNWMFPALPGARWPECYEPLRKRFEQLRPLRGKPFEAIWLDQWNL
jgi:ABC-type thiamine transport system substrate-binding protein